VTGRLAPAPNPSFRLIPSRFPPIGLFDTVATPADLQAVIDLAGWTNDRLVAERVARLPRSDWIHGRPNASIVMAAFLHVPPEGSRFDGPGLGAWYAAASFTTATVEVAHHLRRETVATGRPMMRRQFRAYQARLEGQFIDIRGERETRPGAYDPASHAGSRAFGETVRTGDGAGIVWDSVRHRGGICVVSYRPRGILDVMRTDHVEITVAAHVPRIDVRRLAAASPAD
jgi:hypothetical protein